MVVTQTPPGAPPAVIWHELECGEYRADLPLWRELAEDARERDASAAILDIGAGSGRVALDLARAGHRVTALDSDRELLAALRQRVGDASLATVHADARSFELERRDFALCLVPMQTIQLLGGAPGRAEFLRQAHSHLRPGALLACAIVTELEPFDAEREGRGPSPETALLGETLFASRAVSVRLQRHSIRIERERSVTLGDRAASSHRAPAQRNVVVLDRVSAARLRREGREAGFTDAPRRSIEATEEHVGSTVVMLRA